jgi:phage baseplate assembly protein W
MAVVPTAEISIPFRLDGTGGVAQIGDDQSRIAQHFVTIIGTIIGERVMLPRYGSTTRLAVFGGNDPVTESIVASQLEAALALWEPTVTIKAVESNFDPANPSTMTIQIDYSIDPGNTVYSASVVAGGGVVRVVSF